MLKATIQIEGKTWNDLALALEEAQDRLNRGYFTAADSINDFSYSYEVLEEKSS